MIEDRDMTKEDYEFPYVYNNPCRGLLSRRLSTKANKSCISTEPKEYREKKKHFRGGKVYFTATKGLETIKGERSEISTRIGVAVKTLFNVLASTDTATVRGWEVKRVRCQNIYRTVFDGDKNYFDIDIDNHKITENFKHAENRLRKRASNGDIVLHENLLYSKEKTITRNNFMNYVKYYAYDGNRYYFGKLKYLLSLVEAPDNLTYYQNQLSTKGVVNFESLTILRGVKNETKN